MFERTAIRRKALSPQAGPSASDPVVYTQLEVGDVDSPFEHEAEAIAGQVMRKIDSGVGGDDAMSQMEHAFGADFSGVRLHTDSAAASASADLQARAFTHGSDIYFGKGEFKPETSSGRHLLAHELTHTLQQSGASPHGDSDVARRSPLPHVTRDTAGPVRRWALDKGVDLTKITALRTVGTAQQTFLAKDAGGKEIVVKPGSVPMNLLQLADIVHQSVHESDYIKSYGLDGGQKAILAGKIADPTVATGPSWTQSGAATPGALLDGEDDAAKARRMFADMVATTTSPLTAMTTVDGKNGKQLAKTAGTGQNAGGSAMRDRLESPMFMRSAGHSVATDAFTGNGDRLSGGNMGNFMSTDRDNFTMIDNMDHWVGKASFANTPTAWISDDLKAIGTNPRAKAEKVIKNMLLQFGYEGEDKTSLLAWVNEPGTNRMQFMVDDMTRGIEEAAERIVQTYATNKSKKAGRELKKAIKGIEADDGQVDYWEILKARATVLKDPGAAEKMVERLKKRHAAAQKKRRR